LDSTAATLSTGRWRDSIGGGKTLGEFPRGTVAGHQYDTSPRQDHDLLPLDENAPSGDWKSAGSRADAGGETVNVLRVTLPAASFVNWYFVPSILVIRCQMRRGLARSPNPNAAVLHRHGDTFDLPASAARPSFKGPLRRRLSASFGALVPH
jgi:hypothetical protein